MSFHAFWHTVQRSYESAASAERGDFWLCAATVGNFNPADFDFLPEEKRAKLKRLVEDFAKVAKEPGDRIGPVTPAEIDEAKLLIMEIAKILDFERYQDPDALRLGTPIERELQGRDLGEVERLEFKTDYDPTGAPEIWIWAYLSDDAVETDEKFRANVRRIRPIIDSIARKTAADRWPYIAFRSMGELAHLAEVRRAL